MSLRSLTVTVLTAAFSIVTPTIASPQNIYDSILLEDESRTPNISTEAMKRILEDQSALIVDVRTFEEYALGHIPGAVNVAGKAGSTRAEFTSDAAAIGRMVNDRKSGPIVIYCAGPFCGKAKRVAADLLSSGYTRVSRYQLGIPVWRALGGVTEIELQGLLHVLGKDRTAVFVDVRDLERFEAGSLPNARNIQARHVHAGKGGKEIADAKQDGRLPMQDHNTRVIVFGRTSSDARHVAEALARNAFHNVSFFTGSYSEIRHRQISADP